MVAGLWLTEAVNRVECSNCDDPIGTYVAVAALALALASLIVAVRQSRLAKQQTELARKQTALAQEQRGLAEAEHAATTRQLVLAEQQHAAYMEEIARRPDLNFGSVYVDGAEDGVFNKPAGAETDARLRIEVRNDGTKIARDVAVLVYVPRQIPCRHSHADGTPKPGAEPPARDDEGPIYSEAGEPFDTHSISYTTDIPPGTFSIEFVTLTLPDAAMDVPILVGVGHDSVETAMSLQIEFRLEIV